MSETIRSYSGGGLRTRRRGKQGRRIGSFLLIALLTVLVWAFWSTRDTHTMASLIPGEQSYAIYVPDLLSRRDAIASSPLWDLLPEASPYRRWRDALADNFGLPEWVLNNFIYGLCHVSGKDVAGFEDVLLVTRMTSVGTLVEKLNGFSDAVESDWAGGLKLRSVPELGLFYAVRGRVLIASPHRDAVIHALTLTEETAVSAARLADAARSMQGELLLGRFRLAEEVSVGQYLDGAEIRLWLHEAGARAVVRARPQAAWRDKLATFAGNASATPLTAPAPGPIQLSANFGTPAPDQWAVWAEAWGVPDPWESTAAYFQGLSPDYGDQSRAFLDVVRGTVGAGWRLTCSDINLDAILPVPEFVLTMDTRGTALPGVLAALPAEGPAGDPWAPVPRYDEATGLVTLPLMGGPAFAPSLSLYGEGVLLSNSQVAAARALTEAPAVGALEEAGNLYLRVEPGPAMDMIMKGLNTLADNGLVRDHTPVSLQQAAEPYEALADKIDEVRALAAVEGEAIRADFRLTLATGE